MTKLPFNLVIISFYTQKNIEKWSIKKLLESNNTKSKIDGYQIEKLNELCKLDCEIDDKLIERIDKLQNILDIIKGIDLDDTIKLERLEYPKIFRLNNPVAEPEENYIKNKDGTFNSLHYVFPKKII